MKIVIKNTNMDILERMCEKMYKLYVNRPKTGSIREDIARNSLFIADYSKYIHLNNQLELRLVHMGE